MNAPWPLNPLGDVVDQARYIVWNFEGADLGHHVVDNPRDPGGRTLSGLTLLTYSREFLRLPAPRLADVAEFDALSLDDVVHVIAEVFAMRTGVWQIGDAALRLAVLDFAVHAGADDAIPALQRGLGVVADGILGRDTLAVLERHPKPRALVAAVMDERYQKAGRVVIKRPASLGFLNSWLHRYGRVLRLTAAAVILAGLAGPVRAQDGGEIPNGVPASSVGRRVPDAVGTAGKGRRRYWPMTIAQVARALHTHGCVTGTVTERVTEADGDVHVRLEDGKSFLIAEIIPEIPVAAPAAGVRAEVCGITRYDGEHKWPELHPVFRVREISGPRGARDGVAGTTDEAPLVTFLQPKRAFVLEHPRGVDIPVQLRVEPHADNRAVSLTYCDGAFAWPLEGADDSVVQPVAPLTFHIFESCLFVATVLGPGGKVRARAVLDMKVCGGLEACDDAVRP